MLTPDDGLPLLVVGAALFDDTGRVLVQRRPDGKQHGGLWEFPGGKVEPGETPEVALVRELAEELGIVVAVDKLTVASFATAPGIVLLLYACRTWTGTPAATDGATLSWVDSVLLGELAMPPVDRPLIAVVRELL